MGVEGVRIIDGLLLQTSSVAPADGLMLKRLLFWRAVGVEGGTNFTGNWNPINDGNQEAVVERVQHN